LWSTRDSGLRALTKVRPYGLPQFRMHCLFLFFLNKCPKECHGVMRPVPSAPWDDRESIFARCSCGLASRDRDASQLNDPSMFGRHLANSKAAALRVQSLRGQVGTPTVLLCRSKFLPA